MKARFCFPAALAVTGVLFAEELYRFTFCRESSPILGPVLDKKGHEEDYYRKGGYSYCEFPLSGMATKEVNYEINRQALWDFLTDSFVVVDDE